MADFTLYPLNDFPKFVALQDVNATTGEVTDLTSGTVTAFFATSNLPTAVAADATLSMEAIHQSGSRWLVFFDASVLTPTLLDTLFSAASLYLIIQYPSGFREYYQGKYSVSKHGTVA